jgi:DNA-binding protein Fis
LLPGSVTGETRTTDAVFPVGDPDKLVREIVFNGIATAAADEPLVERIVNPVERELIVQVMEACRNKSKAAERLGINRNTLHRKLKDYGLE